MKVTEEMYTTLFNTITDTLRNLEKIQSNLKNAQIETEEKYILNEDK